MKVLVTGGAGFIPSNLERLILTEGVEVVSVDRIKRKDSRNISDLLKNDLFTYHVQDVNDVDDLVRISKGCDAVFHLAANSDIQAGGMNPTIDQTDTFQTTCSVLEAMRANGIKKLFFSSTSAVYGDMKGDLNEGTGNLRPISYYGACKLASESLISSYSYMNDIDSLIFRFPNVVGPGLTHGVVYDFIRKLKKDPGNLTILGNGKQRKQYVYVDDLVKGIWKFFRKMKSGTDTYCISTESFTDVDTIADLVCERMGLVDVEYSYTGGKCGWKGDVPTFSYDISKAKRNGWGYKFDSTEAIRETLRNIDIDQL